MFRGRHFARIADVKQLVEKELAISPAIGPNDYRVSDGHAAGSLGDDLGRTGGVSEFLVVRHLNSIHDQDADFMRGATPACRASAAWVSVNGTPCWRT